MLRCTLRTQPYGLDAILEAVVSVQMPEVIFMATRSIRLSIAPQSPSCQLHIRALSPGQLRDFLEMVGRCSPSSLFHRFHGITDGTAYVRYLVATPGHETFTAWSDARCVGVATLARSGCDHEVGVLVEDAGNDEASEPSYLPVWSHLHEREELMRSSPTFSERTPLCFRVSDAFALLSLPLNGGSIPPVLP